MDLNSCLNLGGYISISRKSPIFRFISQFEILDIVKITQPNNAHCINVLNLNKSSDSTKIQVQITLGSTHVGLKFITQQKTEKKQYCVVLFLLYKRSMYYSSRSTKCIYYAVDAELLFYIQSAPVRQGFRKQIRVL